MVEVHAPPARPAGSGRRNSLSNATKIPRSNSHIKSRLEFQWRLINKDNATAKHYRPRHVRVWHLNIPDVRDIRRRLRVFTSRDHPNISLEGPWLVFLKALLHQVIEKASHGCDGLVYKRDSKWSECFWIPLGAKIRYDTSRRWWWSNVIRSRLRWYQQRYTTSENLTQNLAATCDGADRPRHIF